MNFGEYTFHYKLWKNSSLIKHYNDWIGFCSYRRFWTISNKRNVNSFNELKKIIIKKPPSNWKKFDVVLGKPIIFKKIKNIKLIKRNLFEVIKKPSMLINHNTLEDQFRVFHGSFFLDTAIELLPKNYQIDFKNFLKKKNFIHTICLSVKTTKYLKNIMMKFFHGFSNVKRFLKRKNLLVIAKPEFMVFWLKGLCHFGLLRIIK